jgi:hypothetical protein
MLREPEHPYVVQEFETRSDVGCGALHDILEHLAAKDWITCEPGSVSADGRDGIPCARRYRMTERGLREAPKALQRYERLQLRRLRENAQT